MADPLAASGPPPTGTPGTPGPAPRSKAPAPESLMQTVSLLWDDLRGVVSDRVELLALEMQRAGRALATIAGLAAAMVILGLTAWLLLWATVVGALMALGLAGWLALLLAMALNLGGLFFALARLRKQLPLLRLPATRRHLSLSPAAQPSSPPPEPTPHELRPASPATGPVFTP